MNFIVAKSPAEIKKSVTLHEILSRRDDKKKKQECTKLILKINQKN